MSRRMRWRSLTALAAIGVTAVATACTGSEEQPQGQEGQEAAQPESPIRVVPGERSQVRYPDARVDVSVEQAEGGTWIGNVSVEGFELGVPTEGAEQRGLAISDQGQHLHFILDNQPYHAVYSTMRPVPMGELEPGRHVVRVFPSRQWHESVKEPGAFAITEFAVGGVGGPSVIEPNRPLLTYSRPKGSYEGADADSIMVDFYLTNVELGPGEASVHLSVDGQLLSEITEWKPYFLVGVPPGEHTVTLSLMSPMGTKVPGPYNETTRTITVSR